MTSSPKPHGFPMRRRHVFGRGRAAALLAVFAAFTLPASAQSSGDSSGWADTIASSTSMQEQLGNIAAYVGNFSQWYQTSANATAMAAATNYSAWFSAANFPLGFSPTISGTNPAGSVANLLRYAMNLDLSGQGAQLPQPVVALTDSGPALTITYRQRKTMPDVVLEPEYSSDLATWTDVPADNILQVADDDTYTARYIAAMPLTPDRPLYLRVVAHPNNGPVTQWPVSAGGNGHYYQVVMGPGTVHFADAQTYATAHGGYVVTITSAAENAFVFNLINDPRFWTNISGNLYGPLIGATAPSLPSFPALLSAFQWVNNEGALSYTNWSSSPDFRNSYELIAFYAPNSSTPQPTWYAFAREGYGAQNSFVVEFDTNPAGD